MEAVGEVAFLDWEGAEVVYCAARHGRVAGVASLLHAVAWEEEDAYQHHLEIPKREVEVAVHPGWHGEDLQSPQNREDPVDLLSSEELEAVAFPFQIDLVAAARLDVDAEAAADPQTCPFHHFGALVGLEAFLAADHAAGAAYPFASVAAVLRAEVALRAVVRVPPSYQEVPVDHLSLDQVAFPKVLQAVLVVQPIPTRPVDY